MPKREKKLSKQQLSSTDFLFERFCIIGNDFYQWYKYGE